MIWRWKVSSYHRQLWYLCPLIGRWCGRGRGRRRRSWGGILKFGREFTVGRVGDQHFFVPLNKKIDVGNDKTCCSVAVQPLEKGRLKGKFTWKWSKRTSIEIQWRILGRVSNTFSIDSFFIWVRFSLFSNRLKPPCSIHLRMWICVNHLHVKSLEFLAEHVAG